MWPRLSLTFRIDGAALFAAIVEDLLDRGQEAPKVAVATHFHEAFLSGILSPSSSFSPIHMQTVFEQTGHGQEIVYLFK